MCVFRSMLWCSKDRKQEFPWQSLIAANARNVCAITTNRPHLLNTREELAVKCWSTACCFVWWQSPVGGNVCKKGVLLKLTSLVLQFVPLVGQPLNQKHATVMSLPSIIFSWNPFHSLEAKAASILGPALQSRAARLSHISVVAVVVVIMDSTPPPTPHLAPKVQPTGQSNLTQTWHDHLVPCGLDADKPLFLCKDVHNAARHPHPSHCAPSLCAESLIEQASKEQLSDVNDLFGLCKVSIETIPESHYISNLARDLFGCGQERWQIRDTGTWAWTKEPSWTKKCLGDFVLSFLCLFRQRVFVWSSHQSSDGPTNSGWHQRKGKKSAKFELHVDFAVFFVHDTRAIWKHSSFITAAEENQKNICSPYLYRFGQNG